MKHFFRYLPLAPETRCRDLFVIGGGFTLIPPGSDYPPLPHPPGHAFKWSRGRSLREYQLIYITRGGGEFQSTSAGTRRIESGALFALFPGEWHRYRPDKSSGWDEYWLAFDGPGVPELMRAQGLSMRTPILSPGVDQRLQREFVETTAEIRDEAIGCQAVLAARAALILAFARALGDRAALANQSALPAIEAAKCRMIERLDQPVAIEDLARELGVGYSWFRRRFRQCTGLSPAQYRLQVRINHASQLLKTTALPVAEIARQSGFDSAYYFARIFREKSGVTPTEYRQGKIGGGI